RQSAIIDSSRMALWGDSFAAVNPAGMNFAVPWDAEKLPAQSEPGAGLLALLGALLEPQVKTVYVRGGLASYQTILESPFLYVPHDAILPGALTAADMEDMVAALAPRPIKLESLVDGLNRRVSGPKLAQIYESALARYGRGGAFSVQAENSPPATLAAWLGESLKK